MGTPVHTPDGRSVFVISSIPDPSYVVVESEAAISINLINVDLDPEKVQDPLLYSIEIADASSGEHETIHPDAVSFRRRALKIPDRTNDLEIGSHVFLLFERPFEIGTTYRLSIVPEAGLPGA